MKKFSIVAVLIVVLIVGSLVGCSPKDKDSTVDPVTDGTDQTPDVQTPTTDGDDQNPDDQDTDSDKDNEDGQQPTDKYATVGEIIEFKENAVTVLTGDIAQDFAVDADNAKEFYIGETVGVKKESEEKYLLERYADADPTARFTTEGNPILTANGTVKEVAEGKLVITTENGELSLKAGDDVTVKADAKVIVDYTQTAPDSEEKILLAVYDEASKISLTVKSIERTEAGYMKITTADDKDVEKIVFTVAGTVVNCNRTDLSEGDTITVYPGEIREISPIEIDAKMIIK